LTGFNFPDNLFSKKQPRINLLCQDDIMGETRKKPSPDEQEQVLEYLRQSRIVSSLPEFLVKRIISMAHIVQFTEGTEIAKEGVDISRVFFLIRGAVGFYVNGDHIIGLRRTGDIFGEMSSISHRPYPATVIAEEECELIELGSNDFGGSTSDEEHNELDETSTDSIEDMLFRFFTALLTDKLNLIIQKSQE